MPVGTRSLQLSLEMTRLNGSYNDGYADNLSLVLSAVPEPSGGVMLGLGLAALAVARRGLRVG